MKAKHTPGPWEVKTHDDGPYFTEVEIWHQNYGLMAKLPNDSSVWNSDKNEKMAAITFATTMANANLMAAAPDMYDYLVTLKEMYILTGKTMLADEIDEILKKVTE